MRWPQVRAKANGPLGRAYPEGFERSDPAGHLIPAQPTRRWTLQVPAQGAATWIPLDITSPSVLRLRSRLNPDPATGVEFVRMFTATDGGIPVSILDGMPSTGHYAILGTAGRWYYSVFANIACTLDVELVDCSSSEEAERLMFWPKGHKSTSHAQITTTAADAVLLYGNEFVERRAVVIWNQPNVGTPVVRVNLAGTASATKGIPLAPIAATLCDRLVLEGQQCTMESVHVFGASNFVGAVIFE